MAATTIKSTYALDVESVRALDELARRWRVSRSEAPRRAIRGAASRQPATGSEALKALDQLQAAGACAGIDVARGRHVVGEAGRSARVGDRHRPLGAGRASRAARRFEAAMIRRRPEPRRRRSEVGAGRVSPRSARAIR